MTEIAKLGIVIETTGIAKAEADLKKLADASDKAEKATGKLSKNTSSNGIKKIGTDAAMAGKDLDKATKSTGGLNDALTKLGNVVSSGGSPLSQAAEKAKGLASSIQDAATAGGGFSRTTTLIAGSLAGVALGAAAAGAALFVLSERYKTTQREAERATAGAGRATGITIAGINAIAAAEGARARQSISNSRSIASSFASSGNFDASNVRSLTNVTPDFGAQTGRSQAESIERLGKSLASPSEGLRSLADEIGGIDAKTINYVRTLEDAGKKQEAVKVSIDAVRDSVSGASGRLSIFDAAFKSLSATVSNVADNLGRFVQGPSVTQQLEKVNKELLALEKRGGSGLFGTKLKQDKEELLKQKDALEGVLEVERQRFEFETKRAQGQKASIRADELVREFNPQIAQVERLKRAYEDLGKATSTEQGRIGLGNGLEEALRAQEAFANAERTRLSATERSSKEGANQVASILARTAAERLSVDLETQRTQLAGQVVDQALREQQIRNQINAAQANAIREARDANRSASDNLSLAGLLPFQRAQRQIQIDARNLQERTNVPSGGTGGAGLGSGFQSNLKNFIDAVNDVGARQTSGFRTREKQQELYDRFGPGKAAPPGSSQHEKGNAADFVFSSPGARARALEIAPQFGLKAQGSNNGAVHIEGQRRATAAVNTDTEAQNRNTQSLQERALRINEIDLPLKQSNIELQQQQAALRLQEQGFNLSSRAMASAAKEQELLNQFQSKGAEVTAAQRAEIKRLAEGFGEVASRSQSVRLNQEVRFETDQLTRSPFEQGLASRYRGAFGEGYKDELGNAAAGQLRLNETIRTGIGIAENFSNSLFQGLSSGRKFTDVLKDSVKGLAGQLFQIASSGLIRQAFAAFTGGGAGGAGALGGGGGGLGLIGSVLGLFGGGSSGTGGLFAKGGAFSSSGLVPFAKGGAFRNGVVSKPTIFPFAKGGALGVMGEAGPEAIMPLKRDSNGVLGVASTGGGGQSITVVQGNTTIQMTGEMSSQVEARMMKELKMRDQGFFSNVSAANTKSSLRKQSS